VTEYLEELHLAGADLKGTRLENHAKSIKRTHEMLELIMAAANLMRESSLDGDCLYYLLYYRYLSKKQYGGPADIIEQCWTAHGLHITQENYYRYQKKAINKISSILWGYTAKETIEITEIICSAILSEDPDITGLGKAGDADNGKANCLNANTKPGIGKNQGCHGGVFGWQA